MKIDWFNVIYPAIIAIFTSLLGYIASYRLNNKYLKENKKINSIDLIDKFIIEIGKLNGGLDRLSDDAKEKNFFAIPTIQNIKPIINKLKQLSENIVLFPNNELRKKILENVDSAATLTEEIENLEMNPVLGYQEVEKITKEREAEYRTLAIKLLEMNIYYDESTKSFQYINSKTKKVDGAVKPVLAADNKLTTIKSILVNLLQDVNNSQARLNQLNQENQTKRSYFAIKILSIQNELKELTKDLSTTRENLIKQEKGFFLINFILGQ